LNLKDKKNDSKELQQWPKKELITYIVNIETIENFDEPLIFTSHLYAIKMHMTKVRGLSKVSIDGQSSFSITWGQNHKYE